MNQPLDRDTMIKVYKYGTYYNPASKHYGGEETTNVVCDRCYKDHLDVCIGWQTHDMCLQCIHEISRELKKTKTPYFPPNPPSRTGPEMWPSDLPPIHTAGPGTCWPSSGHWCTTQEHSRGQPQTKTYMEQSQFQPQIMTNMEQSQFRPNETRTRMLQRQFREDDDSMKTFMVQSQFRM